MSDWKWLTPEFQELKNLRDEFNMILSAYINGFKIGYTETIQKRINFIEKSDLDETKKEELLLIAEKDLSDIDEMVHQQAEKWKKKDKRLIELAKRISEIDI